MPAKEVKRRRGTGSQNDGFTGADAEITVDSTNKRLRVHDAVRAGGFPFLNVFDIQNQAAVMASVSGTGNAIVLTNSPAAISLTNLRVKFKATADNTGATTVNVDGLGAKNIYKYSSGILVALTGGELKTGAIYELNYDGVQFQLGSGAGSGFSQIIPRIFTTSGTYTPTSGMKYCIVEIVGGGGGSGGFSTTGGNGGNTSFGSIMTANGGSGGYGSRAPGGTASGGDLNIQGQDGGVSVNSTSFHIIISGGNSKYGFSFPGEQSSNQINSGSTRGYGAGALSGTNIGLNTRRYGGGAGGYSMKVLSASTVGSSQTITIGNGGSAGTPSGVDGGQPGAQGICIIWEFV